jgi:hypothetical protein
VPVTNGSIPGAPDGGHSSHAGTLLEGAAVAAPDDPPEGVALDPLLPTALDPVPAPPPPDPEPVAKGPEVDPVAGLRVAAAAEVVGFPFVVVVRVDVVVPVPRLTTPLCVTLPGVAVCAEAGRATAVANSTTQRINRSMGAKRTRISTRPSTAGSVSCAGSPLLGSAPKLKEAP